MNNKYQQKEDKNKWQKLTEETQEIEDASSATEEFPNSEEGEFSTASATSTKSKKIDFPSREELEEQLTLLEKKVQESKEQVVRAYAEINNLQRLAEREKTNAIKYGNEKILLDLLPIVDSLRRALDAHKESDNDHSQGIRLTLDLLLKTLSKHGVIVIDPKPGEIFDPQLHEAVSTHPEPTAKPNTILHVMQEGYQLNGRVIRAAMVVVAK